MHDGTSKELKACSDQRKPSMIGGTSFCQPKRQNLPQQKILRGQERLRLCSLQIRVLDVSLSSEHAQRTGIARVSGWKLWYQLFFQITTKSFVVNVLFIVAMACGCKVKEITVIPWTDKYVANFGQKEEKSPMERSLGVLVSEDLCLSLGLSLSGSQSQSWFQSQSLRVLVSVSRVSVLVSVSVSQGLGLGLSGSWSQSQSLGLSLGLSLSLSGSRSQSQSLGVSVSMSLSLSVREGVLRRVVNKSNPKGQVGRIRDSLNLCWPPALPKIPCMYDESAPCFCPIPRPFLPHLANDRCPGTTVTPLASNSPFIVTNLTFHTSDFLHRK